jgi:hypothetical protein
LESIAGNSMTTTLAKWIQQAVDNYHSAHPDMDRDTYLLSVPPTSTVKSYKAMKAYGYHYRVLDESNSGGYVTYDSGLISVAEHMVGENSSRSMEMGYVGELVGIYEFNYGGTSEPINLMEGRWVKPQWRGTRATMKKDKDGLLLANFSRASLTTIDPFIFPNQVLQAFFLDVEERPGWRVVCHNEPRDSRISGDKLVFSLDNHTAFDHPYTVTKSVAAVGADYTPVTTVDVWSDERTFDLLAFDEDSLTQT